MPERQDNLIKNGEVKGDNRFLNTFLVFGWATGSTILAGVILESFLKIPASQVSTHLAAEVPAAILGAGIGVYLNRLDSRASRKR